MISSLMLMLVAVQLAASKEYLLPGDVVPTHYDVRLLYNVDHANSFPFYGVVEIQILIKEPTSKILLHSSEYTIANDKIKLVGQNVYRRVSVVDLNTKFELLTLQTAQELQAGERYTLVIPFFGNLKLGLDGVYVSSYVDKVTNIKEYIIATQFGQTSARKGFPCFDEPIYKATFKITIGHNKGYTALSNMPLDTFTGDNALDPYWSWNVIEQRFNKTSSDFVWDEFKNSVSMSTYLVAFLVSKFQYVESSAAGLSQTKIRIWARSDAIEQTAYAATLGPKVLSFYEDWFNVSFPLPKLDMVAIPDFANGAMENWGLITYRETALLYDEEQSSSLYKEEIAEVIAHEVAHQWFGNLVTMKWWTDLWLKEGFACFMAYMGVSASEPTWNAGTNYAADDILSLLIFDALKSSHSVSVPKENSLQISEMLDSISYLKGSVLIRMMSIFLGETVFKKALHNYLVKYSYRNAEQDDLWAELTEVSHQYAGFSRNVTVKEVMDTWTTQTGYPLLTVHRDYSDGSLTIRQKRYLSRGSTNQMTSWWVPLRVLSEHEVGQDQTPLKWLAADQGVSTPFRFEHGADREQWVLFNSDMVAPYRVNYDEHNLSLLSRALASDSYTNIPVLGRVQLLSDAFELARTSVIDYSTTLELAKYLHHETEFLPVWTAFNALEMIQIALMRTPDYGVFQKFVRFLIGEKYSKAGGLATKTMLNKDNPDSVKMQIVTSKWACTMKVPGCEENAIELFQSWMNTENPDENNPIPLDLRPIVYCAAVSRGSVLHWQFVLARMKQANVASAREELMHALSCTHEVWKLAQYLEWTVQPESELRQQDAASVLEVVVRSSVGYYIAKDFIYTRIDEISKVFSGQSYNLGEVIKVLLNQFTTQRELDEFIKWRNQNAKYLEDVNQAVQQGIESASVNIEWLQRNGKRVVDKLRELTE